MKTIELVPKGPIDVDVSVPGSKSITNRALVCAALANGESVLRNASLSDDSRLLVGALRQLGVAIDERETEIRVLGGTRPSGTHRFDLGNAGTSLRFLTSMLCLGKGTFTVDGNARMRERPIRGLVDSLRSLGAEIRYLGVDGYPPIEIRANGLNGGRVDVPADESSQFLSSLLMAAPHARGPLEVVSAGAVASKPYVDMTRRVMQAFRGGPYVACSLDIEGDAAAAGYWWAMAATTGGRARVSGIDATCAQAEYALVRDLKRMGCRVSGGDVAGGPLAGIDVDMNDHPDSVPALAVVALFAKGPTRIRNVRHLRFKETDRLAALAKELAKLGARVVEHADGLDIDPPAKVRAAEIETYGDHRMAMSFAVAGAAAPGIVIQDPDCVSKSYPGFWEELRARGLVRPA